MTIAQQVFALFYAIFWGTAANAQPKWKAFAWGRFFEDEPHKYRIGLSFALLNVLPVAYFIVEMRIFQQKYWDGQDWKQLLAPVMAAFAAFGFYRLWTAVVQRKPESFFGRKPDFARRPEQKELWERTYPGLTWEDDLNPRYARPNLLFAFAYIVVAGIAGPALRWI